MCSFRLNRKIFHCKSVAVIFDYNLRVSFSINFLLDTLTEVKITALNVSLVTQ